MQVEKVVQKFWQFRNLYQSSKIVSSDMKWIPTESKRIRLPEEFERIRPLIVQSAVKRDLSLQIYVVDKGHVRRVLRDAWLKINHAPFAERRWHCSLHLAKLEVPFMIDHFAHSVAGESRTFVATMMIHSVFLTALALQLPPSTEESVATITIWQIYQVVLISLIVLAL